MADHPRSSEQKEADDVAASQGCGMFDFLKKKPEDVENAYVTDATKEKKEEDNKKPSLAERLHHSDSSSSDEEVDENGEKKKKRKGLKEKVFGHKEEDVADQEKIKEKLPAAKGTHEQANKAEHEDGEKKGFMEKIKEKLPASSGGEVKTEHHEDGKEKGFMEKIKEKLPGGHHGKLEPEAHNEKGFMEKIKEKLPGHNKHEDNDAKKKETY